MESKRITFIFMTIGATLGGYVPLLWGESYFSFSSILLSALGAIAGIWVAFRLTH